MEAALAIADWSPTAANNGTTLGVNIAEGCPPSNVNNAMRQMMADVATGINFSVLGTALASTSLSQFRTAIGVSGGSTSNNNFAALTNSANKVPYMTGSDAWSTFTATSFMRGVMGSGDAATALSALGGVNIVASSIAAGSGYIKLNISGTTFIIQWVDATSAGNTSATVSFPTAFASWARAWIAGGDNDTAATQNNPTIIKGSTTTSAATVVNANPDSIPITVFAIGV